MSKLVIMRKKAVTKAVKNISLLTVVLCGFVKSALAEDMVTHHINMAMETPNAPLKICPTAGKITNKNLAILNMPFNNKVKFSELESSNLWTNIIANLWINKDKSTPCFGMSDSKYWTSAVSIIPADIVGIQASKDGQELIIYSAGIPDYLIRTPGRFISFTPGNTYAIYKISAEPIPDTAPIHEFSNSGVVGFFVNGSSIFNYTDTFSYNNAYAWAYDANVAEAFIVNSDIAHATPSDMPLFPKSRGIFHNHQMSRSFLQELHDPFALGQYSHSKVVAFAIDSTPIYGPLGYTSKDQSSGLKVLKSSYIKRNWLQTNQNGSGHRSALPEWAVNNWDGSNEIGEGLSNLFQKPKSEMLFSDGKSSGPIIYNGDDSKLAAELKFLSQRTTLYRDKLGYVYWLNKISKPDGSKSSTRNYMLKSSKIWGPDFDSEILPVSYQIADKSLFYFKAIVGTFAEDYEFVNNYGDLDFYNGIDSYVPDRKANIYHYVTGYDAKLTDKNRLEKAQFPYIIGIQYKNKVDAFNGMSADPIKAKYFANNESNLNTVYDLGIIGKESDGSTIIHASVITTWQDKLDSEKMSCHN